MVVAKDDGAVITIAKADPLQSLRLEDLVAKTLPQYVPGTAELTDHWAALNAKSTSECTLAVLSEGARAAALSPNADTAVVLEGPMVTLMGLNNAGPDGLPTLSQFEIKTYAQEYSKRAAAVAVSPDGRYVAALDLGDSNRALSVVLIDVQTVPGKFVSEATVEIGDWLHRGELHFSGDGKLLLASGHNGSTGLGKVALLEVSERGLRVRGEHSTSNFANALGIANDLGIVAYTNGSKLQFRREGTEGQGFGKWQASFQDPRFDLITGGNLVRPSIQGGSFSGDGKVCAACASHSVHVLDMTSTTSPLSLPLLGRSPAVVTHVSVSSTRPKASLNNDGSLLAIGNGRSIAILQINGKGELPVTVSQIEHDCEIAQVQFAANSSRLMMRDVNGKVSLLGPENT